MLQEQAKYGTHLLALSQIFSQTRNLHHHSHHTVILRHNLGKLSPLDTSQSVEPFIVFFWWSWEEIQRNYWAVEFTLANCPDIRFTNIRLVSGGQEFLNNCSNKFREDREDSVRRRNQFWLIFAVVGLCRPSLCRQFLVINVVFCVVISLCLSEDWLFRPKTRPFCRSSFPISPTSEHSQKTKILLLGNWTHSQTSIGKLIRKIDFLISPGRVERADLKGFIFCEISSLLSSPC